MIAALMVVALAGCYPNGPSPTPSATVSGRPLPTPNWSPSPTPSPSASPTPSPDATLPAPFPITGALIDDAQKVVNELHRVAGRLPVVKLDISTDQATLTVVTPDRSVRSYRWRDNTISRMDSDVQYLGQTTFYPAQYPLGQTRRMLDTAALMAGSSTSQVLQIVEFKPGWVYMSVTTRPESKTVFFNRDGSAVTELGLRSVEDITMGLADVVSGTFLVRAVGFGPDQGYWADVPEPGGIVERRTRKGSTPVFDWQRTDPTTLAPFDSSLIDPAAIARAISSFAKSPDEICTVSIDNQFQRSQPVSRYDCGGRITFTDMQGRDMTDQLG